MTLKVDNIQNENASEANVVLNSNGSISIPSQIKHVGDDNTLIEFETDTVKLQTAGSTRFIAKSDGKVGIGHDSPLAPLHVLGPVAGATADTLRLSTAADNANVEHISIGFDKNAPDTHPMARIGAEELDTGDRRGHLYFETRNSNSDAAPTERMRITNDGKVGIGATPIFKLDILEGTANTGANANNPSQLSVTGPNKVQAGNGSGGATVFINSNTDMAADTGGSISFTGRNTSASSTTIAHAVIKGAKENNTSGNFESYYAVAVSNHAAGGLVERMRINSEGMVLAGTATPLLGAGHSFTCSDNSGGGALVVSNTDTATSSPACSFATATNSTATSNFLVKFFVNGFGSGSGGITANGSTAAAFATFSDERLKENIVNLPSQWNNIKNLRPVEFDFKAGGHQIGFIAQEFENVYPDAVSSAPSEKDPDVEHLLLTGWSKTEARLVKALQEAITKIETLETKVAALEAG